MNLFQRGPFYSHSGLMLPDKIECEALTRLDWECIAAWFASRLRFSKAIGVPRGGLSLAEALHPYRLPGHPVLLVDDVLTTGASMEEARLSYPGAAGAVLFCRAAKCPDWIFARFHEQQVEALLTS